MNMLRADEFHASGAEHFFHALR